MKDLSLAPGIGSDSGFIRGNIKDNQTVVGEHVNQDIIQFFQKIVNIARITPNGDYDNETNGYQLLEAFYYAGTVPRVEAKVDNLGNVGKSFGYESRSITATGTTGTYEIKFLDLTVSNPIDDDFIAIVTTENYAYNAEVTKTSYNTLQIEIKKISDGSLNNIAFNIRVNW